MWASARASTTQSRAWRGLLSVAVLPGVVGLTDASTDSAFTDAVGKALLVSAGLSVVGSLIAALTIQRSTALRPMTQASINQSCQPCVREEEQAA